MEDHVLNEFDLKAVSMQFALYREGVEVAQERHPSLDDSQKDIFGVAYSRDHMGVPTRFLIGADGKPIVKDGKVLEAQKTRVASPASNEQDDASDFEDLASAREMAADDLDD